jgi:hypothetical protein
MSRRLAQFTQADVARVLRAAKQVGATSVEVKVGGTVVTVTLEEKPLDQHQIVRL